MHDTNRYMGLIHQFSERLPVPDDARVISLNEGNTPLIRLNNIPRAIGKDVDIYVKYEGLNPTGSFKDRGMTVAVTKAVEEGATAIICASTGNTSAAAAAYAARAGIACFVVIPEGKIAMGKLAQAMMHGAVVMQIDGNFDQGLELVKAVAGETGVTIVNSINPYRLQGQKTASFEIVEQLGGCPDFHCLPVGNADNISAHWMGYTEYFDDGIITRRPRMVGYQAERAAPFLRGEVVVNPETVATAIRIGNPQSWEMAWASQAESEGWFHELSDAIILTGQRRLAQEEGIFCEPASAASIAGCLQDIESGRIPEGSKIVCTLTGHGLKDPDVAIGQCQDAVVKVKPELEDVRRVIENKLKDIQ